MAAALVYAFVLFILLLAGTLAIVRFSRRFRAYIGRRASPPTQSGDVWAMHKPPPPVEPDEDDSDPGGPLS